MEVDNSLNNTVSMLFHRFYTEIDETKFAVCIPTVKLRNNNTIEQYSRFKNVFLFVLDDEVSLYSEKFPWATIVNRPKLLNETRNIIIEFCRDKFDYFMMVDDDVVFRKYEYNQSESSTKTVNDYGILKDSIFNNVRLMDSFGDIMYFDRGGFTSAKLIQRLNGKFGSPTFQAFIFKTSIFNEPELRFTTDSTIPEDDAFNELVLYKNIKYFKAIDLIIGGEIQSETSNNTETVITNVSHDELFKKVKKYRNKLKRIGRYAALKEYGYPNLK